MISLVGTLGIAALPPLNGFVSEWMLFEGLFQGFRVHSHVVGVLMLIAAAVIGLTAGLAVLAFARAFGIGFLGMPRSAEAAKATEAGQPILGPGLLAVACVALGVGAPAVLIALDHVVRGVTGVQLRPVLLVSNLTVIPGHTNLSGFSPTYLAVFLVAVSVVPIAIYAASCPRGATHRGPVWDGGLMSYRARMQYTATMFSNPVRAPSNVSIVPTFTSTAGRTIPPAALVLCITGPRSSQFSKSTSTDPWSALSRALPAFSNQSSRAMSTGTCSTSLSSS